ncbi:MAG: hypothetical protein OXC02_02265 [Rhodobacteraceae bacterium]|nr:hypothetical protein [Paracoccaceae bacterium]
MTQTSFDTLATTKLLESSGIAENQAEAITIAIKSGLEGDLATKVDIINLSQSIAETNRNLDEVKRQLDKHDERFNKIDILLASINTNFKWVYAIGSTIILFLAMLVIPGVVEFFSS